MLSFISYARKSTSKQDHSFEAQMSVINSFIERQGGVLVNEYYEQMAGGRNDRPVLQQAIDDAVKNKHVLITSHVDRLSRRISLVANLNDIKGLRICVVELGSLEASKLILNMRAVISQEEREAIRRRMVDTIAVIKASGRKWGNHNLGSQHGPKARETYKRMCKEHNDTIVPRIKALRLSGINSYTAIARCLNTAGYTTTNNKKFYPQTIKNICLTYSI